jgi:hypothetical protein
MDVNIDYRFYLAQFLEIVEDSKSPLHFGPDTLGLIFEGYSQGIVRNLHPSRQKKAQQLLDQVWVEFLEQLDSNPSNQFLESH